MSNVVLKFSSPSGASAPKPSEAMRNALRQLTESDEIQSLVADAAAKRRKLVVQVYHSNEGHPFLIHLTAVPMKTA